MDRVFWAALLIGLAGCTGDRDPVDGLDVVVREGPADPSGALERCATLTVTEQPLTLDRIAFEANEPGVHPEVYAWTDVIVSRTLELCLPVCACQHGEIGHFVVDDDGQRTTRDVDWPQGVCCVAPPPADAGPG